MKLKIEKGSYGFAKGGGDYMDIKLSKPKKTKTRKQSLASLQRKADHLLQQVFTAGNPTCIVCGDKTNCGHHVIYKSQSAYLRYIMDNLVPLCMSCHCKHHQSGDSYILAKIIQVKGDQWMAGLQQTRRTLQKTNKGYLLGVIEELERLN